MRWGSNEIEYEIKSLKDFLDDGGSVFHSKAEQVYKMLKFISDYYPSFKDWYWKKVVPETAASNPNRSNYKRSIFVAVSENKIVGAVILKKHILEVKLCTIFVAKDYRNFGIGTDLLKTAFEWLGTTKPLCSIPLDRIDRFHRIIPKYRWELTAIPRIIQSTKATRELVFNGPSQD